MNNDARHFVASAGGSVDSTVCLCFALALCRGVIVPNCEAEEPIRVMISYQSRLIIKNNTAIAYWTQYLVISM